MHLKQNRILFLIISFCDILYTIYNGDLKFKKGENTDSVHLVNQWI